MIAKGLIRRAIRVEARDHELARSVQGGGKGPGDADLAIVLYGNGRGMCVPVAVGVSVETKGDLATATKGGIEPPRRHQVALFEQFQVQAGSPAGRSRGA